MSEDLEKPDQLQEPSVLDDFKSLFHFGNGDRIQIPSQEEALQDEKVGDTRSLTVETPTLHPGDDVQLETSFAEAPSLEIRLVAEASEAKPFTPFPWRSLLAFLLALAAQRTFEPPHTETGFGIVLYIAALSLVGWALYHGEWKLPAFAPTSEGTDPLTYRGIPLILAFILGFWAFTILGDNLFTKVNVIVWVLATIFLTSAFWLNENDLGSVFRNTERFFQERRWTISITSWTILLIAATALIIFFRFYHTPSVPPEPFSDHAEKLLDVYDVSQGQTHIFFPRNTGREAIQMYWTLL